MFVADLTFLDLMNLFNGFELTIPGKMIKMILLLIVLVIMDIGESLKSHSHQNRIKENVKLPTQKDSDFYLYESISFYNIYF